MKTFVKIGLRRAWRGHCPICEAPTTFVAYGQWYRDELLCARCGSIPRERALMRTVANLYPAWRTLAIHESSPSAGGASAKLATQCVHYTASQYLPDLPPGSKNAQGQRAEDLERQTFADQSFDIVVTQDVFEHLFEPNKAIVEIMRTIKPGGAHIMTVPIVNKSRPSARRATRTDGDIVHLVDDPQFHGNPVGDGAALVTIDWGYDLASYLTHHSGCPTTVFHIDDRRQGIVAEYIEVVVTTKPLAATFAL